MHHTLDFCLRWALALITFSKLLAPAADSYSWLLDVCAVQVIPFMRTAMLQMVMVVLCSALEKRLLVLPLFTISLCTRQVNMRFQPCEDCCLSVHRCTASVLAVLIYIFCMGITSSHRK